MYDSYLIVLITDNYSCKAIILDGSLKKTIDKKMLDAIASFIINNDIVKIIVLGCTKFLCTNKIYEIDLK